LGDRILGNTEFQKNWDLRDRQNPLRGVACGVFGFLNVTKTRGTKYACQLHQDSDSGIIDEERKGDKEKQ